MTATLWRKTLRDMRTTLLVTCVLLLLFQVFWVKVASRISTELSPVFQQVAKLQGLRSTFFQERIFRGPGKVFQTILGGENIRFEQPQDLLTVGYLHPLIQIIFGLWAAGRAAGAVAGEIEKGTMELLLAQPISRTQVVKAHLLVDLTVIPLLAVSLWAGTMLGIAAFAPFVVDPSQFAGLGGPVPTEPQVLPVSGVPLSAALPNVAALLFAGSGLTMALSAAGRQRFRVFGAAMIILLGMFVVNVLGQLWDGIAFLRPLTLFYYYQPQVTVLDGRWSVGVWGLPVNAVLVLVLAGAAGYVAAWRAFVRRDLPAPL